ncbi:orotidine 5'-phosphate decarboxylase / HUMPS family protein [Enterococcus sp. LJL90]
MKIQVAIDRVTLSEACLLVNQLQAADIIELGTSLGKDYGLLSVTETKKIAGSAKILADIKTIDEGEYEFRQYFAAGADILTVMGASALETLEICYQVAEELGKEMMIDLLECSVEKIAQIAHFEKAIYSLHFAKDSQKPVSVVEEVQNFKARFPQIKRTALAGSLTLEKVAELKDSGLEIAIVGSSIVKSPEPQKELVKFKEVLK